MTTQTLTAASLSKVLAGHTYRYASEIGLHLGLEQAMKDAGLTPQPEVRLGKAGRIDFIVGRVGVEVKVAGGTEALLRQITRYAHRHELDEILVVTTCRRHRALPETAAGKPVRVHLVGGV